MPDLSPQPKIKALYCRLSKDDERTGESLSIETQRETLLQYAKEHGMSPVRFYVDDGYTGLNYDRPAFRQMIEDITMGQVDTVITKDLSRLGRDHIKTGEYTDIFFPTHRIRYIAINDGYDSEDQHSTYYGVLKQAINEFYSRDNSIKIKAAFQTRAKAGKYHATVAPYGYLKDPEDHNHLIPDPETAAYVKKIYELVLKGWGNHRIRDYLREHRVPIPSWIHHERGMIDRSAMFPNEESKYIWRPDTLRALIRNPVYCGDTAMGKTETIFKTKKHPRKEETQWIWTVETHEPIVTRKEWKQANHLIAVKRQDYRESVIGGKNIFSGILKCADCGKAMSRRRYGRSSGKIVYACSSYCTYGVYRCSQHKLFEEDCYASVLADIRKYAKIARTDKNRFLKVTRGYLDRDQEKKEDINERRRKLQKQLSETNRAFDKLYEEHMQGMISDSNYARLAGRYQKEQERLEKQLRELELEDQQWNRPDAEALKCADLFNRLPDITMLTSEILNALIDRIDVHEPKPINGIMMQTLHIHYRFSETMKTLSYPATRERHSVKKRKCESSCLPETDEVSQ